MASVPPALSSHLTTTGDTSSVQPPSALTPTASETRNNLKAINKLVRDLIPDLLKSQNVKYTIRTLNDKEYAVSLKAKLNEEIAELNAAKNDKEVIEEAADVMEVLLAKLNRKGLTFTDVETVRQKKAQERGNFSAKIYKEVIVEAADVMEVLLPKLDRIGKTFADVEAVRQKKAEERGGFLAKIYLEQTWKD